jgi:putative transposase
MNEQTKPSRHTLWAHLRFAIIGHLLSAPPARGELADAIHRLSQKQWQHPSRREGELVQFGFSTIERWYYGARRAHVDPVGALRRRVRKDSGAQPSLGQPLREALVAQYRDHRGWSFQLHYDNLKVLCAQHVELGPLPSYSTVARFMKAHDHRPKKAKRNTPGAERALARLDAREVRSYEAEYVHGVWHADFHRGRRQVVMPDGSLVFPQLFGTLDDRSRLCCHAQWYLAENAENYVHGMSQAFLKRGLCRCLLSDNGGAMTADETTQGLTRLGVSADTTLAYSPYQNGKQEHFWTQVEGRLMPMLENVPHLTLAQLNEALLAWVELEYNQKFHSEIGTTPLRRYLDDKSVGRPSPSPAALKLAFMADEQRSQRQSDGTISLAGVRFEIPSRFRHLGQLRLRYAAWDLSHVVLVDPRTDVVLERIYPLDKTRNADGYRRTLEPIDGGPAPAAGSPRPEMAPLLAKLIADYARSGLPPAYLPKDERTTPDTDINEVTP